MNDKLGIRFIFITIVIIGFAGTYIDAYLATNFSIILTVAAAVGFIIYEIRDAQGYYSYEEDEQEGEEGDNDDSEEQIPHATVGC